MANATGAGLPKPSPHPPRVEYLATLSRHSGVVNCVRFSPSGDMLASAGDDGTVMLWHLTDRPMAAFGEPIDESESSFEKEHWRMTRMVRVSSQEIYDMAWSPSGDALIVGGTDFVARVINPHDGTVVRELSDHSHYVQGVAWDPLNEFMATQSSDRSVHVHSLPQKVAPTSSSTSSSTGPSTYVPPVTRNSRMDLHRRTGSGVPGSSSKPALRRGSSHTSQMESDTEGEIGNSSVSREAKARQGSFTAVRSRSARSHTPMEPPASTTPSSHAQRDAIGGAAHSTTATPAGALPVIARAATPTPASSVPQSPAFSSASATMPTHPMHPPQKTPSRRSSFSGSQAEGATSPPTSIASFATPGMAQSSAASIYKAAVGTSAPHSLPHSLAAVANGSTAPIDLPPSSATRRSHSRAASIRSPSPAPLPAIRPPPSPRQRIQAAQLAGVGNGAGGSLLQAGMRLYGDENFSGFFRRLSFSPDGALLVTPSGIFEAPMPASPMASSPSKSPHGTLGLPASSSHSPQHPHSQHGHQSGPRSTVYIYGRGNLLRSNAPIAHLPGHKTATLVVRFSPILYELRRAKASASQDSAEGGGGIAPHPNIPLEAGKQKTVNLDIGGSSHSNGPDDLNALKSPSSNFSGGGGEVGLAPSTAVPARAASMIGLPYRMVFAVATHDVVWIYDTQQGGPLACFSNMHYAAFTDLTWSADGQTLMMSSSDGYCSVAVFDHGELGTPWTYTQQPALLTHSAPNAPSSLATSLGAASSTSNTLVPSSSGSTGPVTVLTTKKCATQQQPATAAASSASTPLPKTEVSAPVPAMTVKAETASPAPTTVDSQSASAAPMKKKRRIQPTLHSAVATAASNDASAGNSTDNGSAQAGPAVTGDAAADVSMDAPLTKRNK